MRSPSIEQARELLNDKSDRNYTYRMCVIGILAFALVADALPEDEREEARAIIVAYWQEFAVTA